MALGLLQERADLTTALIQNPFDASRFLDRALCYQSLGYNDLACGDAYMALQILDELDDEDGEHYEAVFDGIQTKDKSTKSESFFTGDSSIFSSAQDMFAQLKLHCRVALIRNLIRVGCLRSAYENTLTAIQSCPGARERFNQIQLEIMNKYKRIQEDKVPIRSCMSFDWRNLPDTGLARREIYPWNTHEPERNSQKNSEDLNTRMKNVAPKCSVRLVELPLLGDLEDYIQSNKKVRQLGLFADEDLVPGEKILSELSILTANNRMYDPLCDTCASDLPPLDSGEGPFGCEGCTEVAYCSKQCQIEASRYHPAVCGLEVEAIGKEVPLQETPDALYFLLLARTFAMAATQDIHPLDLDEVKYLWGDFQTAKLPEIPKTSSNVAALPFSFQYNIVLPLHFLEKMDLGPYGIVARYDLWVMNTLYAKFRGVASGRVNARTGIPEVCSVHPMWSLANHSCAPNVRWEWGGKIEFFIRGQTELIGWRPKGDTPSKNGGIQKGEEILNHYCDIHLPVQERRDWARGPLGGICQCERCRWETRPETS
ncbi:hypothetical protein MMC25_004829 [Agyrium rufum]|nr:hypothetical protein [Agyrium rufum]